MVVTLVKLRGLQFKNSLRATKSVLIGFVVAVLYAISAISALYFFVISTILSGKFDLHFFEIINIFATSLAFIVLMLFPVLQPNSGCKLDPLAFKLLIPPSKKFARQILIADSCNLITVFLFFSFLGATLLLANENIGLSIIYLIGIVLYLLSFQYISKLAFFFVNNNNDKTSNKKSIKQLIVFFIIFIPYIYIFVFGGVTQISMVQIENISNILQWTPFSIYVSFPIILYKSHFTIAVTQFFLSIIFIVLLDYLYCRKFINFMKNENDKSDAKSNVKNTKNEKNVLLKYYIFMRKIGFKQQVATMLSRVFIYWKKDPRYTASISIMAIIPIVAIFGVQTDYFGTNIIFALSVYVAFAMGFSLHADISYDSTAFSTQILCGVKGRTDRIARVVPYFLLMMLIVLLNCFVMLYAGESSAKIMSILVLCLSVFFVSASVSNVIGTVILYPLQVPNSTVFENKGVSNFGTIILVQLVATFITALFSVPIGIFFYMYYLYKFSLILFVIVLIAYGLFMYYIGYRIGAGKYEKNQIILIEKISSWPGHKVKVL